MNRFFPMLILSILICIPHSLSAEEIIALTVTERVAEMYDNFIEEKGGDPLAITDFESPWSIRAVADIVLIQQALYRGGLDVRIRFALVPNPARGILEVKNGRAHMFAHDIWADEFDSSVYQSAPIIRAGEFVKVIFTSPGNNDVLSVRSLEELRRFKPVVSQSWTKDIEELKAMGFSEIILVDQYDSIFRMIESGRGDFTLLSASEISHTVASVEGIVLTPVRGVKVLFPLSRHFMISRIKQSGSRIFEALNKGIAVMREEGIIIKAMTQCGFINDEISGWTVLNPIEKDLSGP